MGNLIGERGDVSAEYSDNMGLQQDIQLLTGRHTCGLLSEIISFFHYQTTAKLKWFEHLWNHDNLFEIGAVQVYNSTRS